MKNSVVNFCYILIADKAVRHRKQLFALADCEAKFSNGIQTSRVIVEGREGGTRKKMRDGKN